MVFFSDFLYGFRSSRSTADLLTVASDRITRVFNRSGATQAVALDISKTLDRVGPFFNYYLANFSLFLRGWPH